MRLFTVGPVMMYEDTLVESGRQLPYFRTDEFSRMMLDSERALKNLLHAPEGSRVAFLTASGTGAMEAAVSNMFSRSDRLLIVVGGGFGRRFAEICDVHGIPHDDLVIAWDEELTSVHLDAYRGKGYAGLLINMDETSTGQLYDIRMVSSFCRDEGMLLVVDAISSFLADPLDMEEDSVDAVIIGSQKALALEAGTSMLVMSPRAYECVLSNGSPTYYLDVRRHVVDQERGQTPFTPSVGTLIMLNHMLRSIEEQGLGMKISRTASLAAYFRRGAKAMGLTVPDYPLSNAVTPVIFDGNAREVFEALRYRHGMTLTPSGGDMAGRMLRVGHIGNLSEDDYDALFEALREVLG